jgi:hypothetical protein
MANGEVYNPDGYDKHKEPKGWGSLCPQGVSLTDAQALLETGVRVADEIYNVDGQTAYRAQRHDTNRWHGHPIPWSRLPVAAWRGLITAGRLTAKDFRKAIRSGLGAEFA